ncbi:hypothetical protein, partial [uncultured Dysosmobacter sp.]|uniref:hypothetical protein n=1 Tax=uncultured Dysosmobacter sp. TaxID=2591384 RepID=UPI002621706C
MKFTIRGRTLSWYTEIYYGTAPYASYKAQCNSKDAQYNFIAFALLESGEISHFLPGENSQFRPDENR